MTPDLARVMRATRSTRKGAGHAGLVDPHSHLVGPATGVEFERRLMGATYLLILAVAAGSCGQSSLARGDFFGAWSSSQWLRWRRCWRTHASSSDNRIRSVDLRVIAI